MTPEGEHLDLSQEEAIRDSFSRQAFMIHLGVRLMTVRRGWCEVIVDYRLELCQQHGYFHGAVIGAIADNASDYAAFTTKSSEASDTVLITVKYKINFIAPARGDALAPQGQVVRPGEHYNSLSDDGGVRRHIRADVRRRFDESVTCALPRP